jgi:hypothetical protein
MKKIGFVAAMTLVGLAILATRYDMVDLPVWHFLGGGKALDPASLHLQGEFVESNLGAAEGPARSLTVRMIAQQFVFVPQCIVVPAGVPITFRITSGAHAEFPGYGLRPQSCAWGGHRSNLYFCEAGRIQGPVP